MKYGAPIHITEEKVCKALKTFKTNKATDPNKINERVVKECISGLIYIINNIIHIFLHLCRVPKVGKIGEIIAVKKKPLPKVDNNLRPVTLTTVLGKRYKRVILPKLSACTKPITD